MKRLLLVLRLALSVALFAAPGGIACYRPLMVDCRLSCQSDGDCPSGMGCSLGLCSAGTKCAVAIAAGEAHTCAAVAGTLKCWGRNTAGQLGTGDRLTRGDNHGEMGDQLPAVDLGAQQRVASRPSRDGTIAIGSAHTCVVLETTGQIKCWGDNRSGQLGLGDSRPRSERTDLGDTLPAVNLGTESALAVTAGVYHTCALLSGGSVKCWGDNRFGQLGLGTAANRGGDGDQMGDTLPPVDLGASATVVGVSAGAYHTCALLAGGATKCWGWNEYGQLGIGDRRSRGRSAAEMGAALPPAGPGPARVATQVAAGAFHTCAVLDQGRALACWGLNFAGQLAAGNVEMLGIDVETTAERLPILDLGTGSALAISAGSDHTCVLLGSFAVRCWGLNIDGELGIGTTDNRGIGPDEKPDRLPDAKLGTGTPGLVSAISAGGQHTCAVQAGIVKCWGANQYGRLGVGDTLARGNGHREISPVRLFGTSD